MNRITSTSSRGRHRGPKALVAFAMGLGLLLASGAAEAEPEREIVLLVNAKTNAKNVSKDFVRKAFLGHTTFWPNNTPIRAYNLSPNSGAGLLFFKKVLKMTPSRYRHHWQSRQLSGRGLAPTVVKSARSLAPLVASTPGAIGYIFRSEIPATTEGIRILPLSIK